MKARLKSAAGASFFVAMGFVVMVLAPSIDRIGG